MKKVKFIKEHPVGIPEGHVTEAFAEDADRWIEQGYCEAVVEDDKPTKSKKEKAEK